MAVTSSKRDGTVVVWADASEAGRNRNGRNVGTMHAVTLHHLCHYVCAVSLSLSSKLAPLEE